MASNARPRLIFHGAIVLLVGLPALVLAHREASGLGWSLLAMGYGFMMALVIGGVVGANAFEPGDTPATVTAFVGAVVGILGAVGATALILMGARAALKGVHTSPLP